MISDNLLEKYVGPVSTCYAAIRLERHNPEIRPSKTENGTPVTPARGNVHINFGFSVPLFLS